MHNKDITIRHSDIITAKFYRAYTRPSGFKIKNHEHYQSKGRHRDLLQRLGNRTTHFFPSWLAIDRLRLGWANDVLSRTWLPRDRARSPGARKVHSDRQWA